MKEGKRGEETSPIKDVLRGRGQLHPSGWRFWSHPAGIVYTMQQEINDWIPLVLWLMVGALQRFNGKYLTRGTPLLLYGLIFCKLISTIRKQQFPLVKALVSSQLGILFLSHFHCRALPVKQLGSPQEERKPFIWQEGNLTANLLTIRGTKREQSIDNIINFGQF